MSEPFFDYISNNRRTISNEMYGYESAEKKYTRMHYVALPPVETPTITLVESLKKRKSTRLYASEPLSLIELSTLLRYGLAQDSKSTGVKKYPFPSGGAFYPIETYLLIHQVEGLETGVYHYASVEHKLAKIAEAPGRTLEEINYDYGCFFESIPPVILHMTMVKSRTIHKYGSLCYVLSLIEAGHRGQNLCLLAAALNTGICPMGGGNYEKINATLGIDGVNEHHIYGVAFGKIIN